MEKKFFDKIIHGGDYNPDQWIDTPEIWDEDMRLMKLANINSATVGIFSWSMIEPEEGVYNFGWLDTMMDKMHENGISVILATPSGARPAWLSQKYPEVLRVEETGIRNEYGVRHNHCLTSPVYREKVRNINRILAERYKDHPALKMWHISNEYGGECHCEKCQEAYRDWLKEYYNNDIDALNRSWWNGFWSHRLNDWSQINSPKFRGENHVTAMKLTWNRFVSDSHISFYENEIAPLREITPDIPITTNLMRMYGGIDYQKFAKKLDLVSWDNYPGWDRGDNDWQAVETAFVHDTFRSMKNGQPFFMMESTPSQVNWHDINKLPRAEMQNLSSIQAVAHGADSVQYFQWRKSRGSSEKFHGAVVGHDGTENTRVFRSVAKTGEILEKIDEIAGSLTRSQVAVIFDWENMWALDDSQGYAKDDKKYFETCYEYHRVFWERGIDCDVVSPRADLSSYKFVVAPMLYLTDAEVINNLKSFVECGGTLLATYMLGTVDKNDLCYLGGIPANELSEVFGICAEEIDTLYPHEKYTASFLGKEYDICDYCENLSVKGAEVISEYSSGYNKGYPAITRNKYGKGMAVYQACRDIHSLKSDLINRLIEYCEIEPLVKGELAHGVTAHSRTDGETKYIFVENYSPDKCATVELKEKMKNMLSGEIIEKAELEPYGFAVLRSV